MNTTPFLLPLLIMLIGSQAAGWLSHRMRLPAVFGALLVGLLVGPSVLGWVAESQSLANLSQIGVLMLMFLAGLETDVAAMRKLGAAAFLTAACGVIVPFGGGVLLSMAFGLALTSSLLVGTILTATSVSITARTLQELGRLQTREGTIILGAAVIDDILGIIVLSIVMGMAGSGEGFRAIFKMILFFPAALALGYFAMPTVSKWVRDWHHYEAGLAIVMGIVLFYAWASEAFGGMAAVTGAFLAGLMVARTEIKERVHHGVSAAGYSLFIPLFFVSIGVETRATSLGGTPLFAALLIPIAIATKVMGCWLGARVSGCTSLEALRIGTGMISRGEVALVIATLGLQSHLIDDGLFSATVMMTLVTTVSTPLLLKLVYALPKSVRARSSRQAEPEPSSEFQRV